MGDGHVNTGGLTLLTEAALIQGDAPRSAHEKAWEKKSKFFARFYFAWVTQEVA